MPTRGWRSSPRHRVAGNRSHPEFRIDRRLQPTAHGPVARSRCGRMGRRRDRSVSPCIIGFRGWRWTVAAVALVAAGLAARWATRFRRRSSTRGPRDRIERDYQAMLRGLARRGLSAIRRQRPGNLRGAADRAAFLCRTGYPSVRGLAVWTRAEQSAYGRNLAHGPTPALGRVTPITRWARRPRPLRRAS